MHEKPNDDLYRIPDEEPIYSDQMSEDEVELRRLLAVYSKDPQHKDTLIGITRILMRKNLYDEAWLYLEPYLTMASDDPEALNYHGIIRFTQGDFIQAEKCFDQALAANPDHHDALYNSAMLYSEKGDFDKARLQFERLTLLENQNPEVFNNLGALLFQNREWEEAEKRFKEALSLDAENSTALRNLIEVLIERGRWEEAQSHLAAYERTDPEPAELEAVKYRLTGAGPQAVPRQQNLTPVVSAALSERPSGRGMQIGIVSDWCPGDRGELAWWLWWSLKENGHAPHVLSWTGKVPHCKEGDRMTQPRYLGRWAIPEFTFSEELPVSQDRFNAWLNEKRLDTVIFVDHSDPWMVEACHRAGAAAIACPAMIGANQNNAQEYSLFDSVLATSPWIQQILENRVPSDRLIPCDLGIDLDRFSPRGGEQRETVFLFDAGYGSTEDLENLMLMLASFGMMSREALHRSRLLVRTHVDWYLLPEEIRSRGEGQFRIDVLSGQMENTHFLGLGNILVHLKLSSGVHWIVPEAAACGVPSIVVDGSPATGWIFDEKMTLKVPGTAGHPEENGLTRATDAKILADTMSTLATDPEMVAFMGSICREKTRQILEGVERSRVVCDKIVTAVLNWKEGSQAVAQAPQMQSQFTESAPQEPEKLLNAIDAALSEGKNSEARELMALYRQNKN